MRAIANHGCHNLILHVVAIGKLEISLFGVLFNQTFFMKILKMKNIPDKMIDWIFSSVTGAKVAVTVNNELGSYFCTHQGLRQGTQCPPFSLIWWLMIGYLD